MSTYQCSFSVEKRRLKKERLVWEKRISHFEPQLAFCRWLETAVAWLCYDFAYAAHLQSRPVVNPFFNHTLCFFNKFALYVPFSNNALSQPTPPCMLRVVEWCSSSDSSWVFAPVSPPTDQSVCMLLACLCRGGKVDRVGLHTELLHIRPSNMQ